MRKIVALLLLSLLPAVVSAQKAQPFVGYIVNKEYNVYIRMDFYQNSVVVPGQSIFGELPGFFGDNQDGRKWLFTSAKVKGRQATLPLPTTMAARTSRPPSPVPLIPLSRFVRRRDPPSR